MMLTMLPKYDVAFSYTSEDRAIAHEIAESLRKENLQVFFDEHSSAELWGANLYDYFEDVYKHSRLCIVLYSQKYSESQWCTYEFKHLVAHSRSRPSFSVLPVQIAGAPFSGDFAHIGFVQWEQLNSEKLTQIVKQRLALLVPEEPELQLENIHVIKRETGWSVKREGSPRAASVHKTREEAITNARKLARRSARSLVVVHRADGSIESQESYGRGL